MQGWRSTTAHVSGITVARCSSGETELLTCETDACAAAEPKATAPASSRERLNSRLNGLCSGR